MELVDDATSSGFTRFNQPVSIFDIIFITFNHYHHIKLKLNQIYHFRLYSLYSPVSINGYSSTSLPNFLKILTCLYPQSDSPYPYIFIFSYPHLLKSPYPLPPNRRIQISPYPQASSSSKTSCSVESCASLTLVLPTPKSTLF